MSGFFFLVILVEFLVGIPVILAFIAPVIAFFITVGAALVALWRNLAS